jgi:hypothetical protein
MVGTNHKEQTEKCSKPLSFFYGQSYWVPHDQALKPSYDVMDVALKW